MLQEKLEEKDAEIARLKLELHQRSMMDKEKNELPVNENPNAEETVAVEAET